MTRDYMIERCLEKLPYPRHFYDTLNDGSLWNIYNKHVVNNIPINKTKNKTKNKNCDNQMTLEECLVEMKKPLIVVDEYGIYYRLQDNGEYEEIYDVEYLEIIKKIYEVDEPHKIRRR